MIISGIILLFFGIIFFVDTLISLTYVALGIASLIVSKGLLKRKGWARTITLVISLIAILLAIISLSIISLIKSGGMIYYELLLFAIPEDSNIFISAIIIYSIIICYLFTKKVKLFFGKVKESSIYFINFFNFKFFIISYYLFF